VGRIIHEAMADAAPVFAQAYGAKIHSMKRPGVRSAEAVNGYF